MNGRSLRTARAARPLASYVVRVIATPRQPAFEVLHLHSGEARRFSSLARLQRWLLGHARASLR